MNPALYGVMLLCWPHDICIEDHAKILEQSISVDACTKIYAGRFHRGPKYPSVASLVYAYCQREPDTGNYQLVADKKPLASAVRRNVP